MRLLRNAASETDTQRHPRQADSANAPLNAFRVETQKTSGAWVLFSRYATRKEALQASNLLASVGQPVRVVAPK